MNEFLLSYLGIVAGLLTLLGIIGLVERVGKFKDYLTEKHVIETKTIPPPEYDPKDVAFKDKPTAPTNEQILRSLKEWVEEDEFE